MHSTDYNSDRCFVGDPEQFKVTLGRGGEGAAFLAGFGGRFRR